MVLCNHVLEHVNDDIQAMSEIHRVLKPVAWLFFRYLFLIPSRKSHLKILPSPTSRSAKKYLGRTITFANMEGIIRSESIIAGLKP